MHKIVNWLAQVLPECLWIALSVGLMYLLIGISWAFQILKKIYFVIFRIPHVKQHDKFHPFYERID